MASQLSIDLVEQALTSHTPVPLSYGDPHQKWLIRSHILSLLRDHPAFTPSFGSFVHDDGSPAYLLFVSGPAKPANGAPAIPLTIWLHENHPLMAPVVHLSDHLPVRRDHPFVDPSGRVTCPYLLTWAHPASSLSGLVTNLLRLFSRDHPLNPSPSRTAPSKCHPALVSRREAIDRLAANAHYAVSSLHSSAMDDIRALLPLRETAAERARAGQRAVDALEEERVGLREAAVALAEEADVHVNWLRVNDRERIEAAIGGDEAVEAAFEVANSAVLECLAAERGVEDAMDALAVAVKEGLVGLEDYVKHVRVLAREQFYHRAMALKLSRGSAILDWGYF